MTLTRKPARLWLDLETTGIDKRVHSIVEIGCIVADGDHNELAAYESAVAVEPDAEWSEWALTHHAASGLLSASACARPLAVVMTDLDLWLATALPEPVSLAGYSISRFDFAWLDWHIWAFGLPNILRHLNHRHYDVSTLLAEASDVGDHLPPRTDPPHRALADCRHALATARALRQLRRSR